MFELSGHSAVVKLCRGYCGKSDDSESGVVFVLEVENVQSANIAALAGLEDSGANYAQVTASFFEPIDVNDGRQDKLFPGFTGHMVAYHAENKHEITFQGFRPKNQPSTPERVSWIGSIVVRERMGARFDVRFVARVADPQAGLMDYITRNINSAVRIELKCDPGFRFEVRTPAQAPVLMELPLPEPTEDETAQLNAVADTLERQDAEAAAGKSEPRKLRKPAKKAAKRGARKAA